MCGIFGVYRFKQNEKFDKERFEKALLIIKHRGPDATGCKFFNLKVGFGHRRLSIIDLSPESNQPFVYKHLAITFNGEIFNYLELKKVLLNEGFKFRTNSDTEVALVSYLHWGEKCVNKFNGMWSFAIYDSNNDKLFCSRDRFGIKPFNYYRDKNRFIFASEIKSILAYDSQLKKINFNSISRYCRETVGAQAVETWFDDILRLPAGHNIIIEKGKLKIIRYWQYPLVTNKTIKFDDALAEYKSLLDDSVRIRLRSDVPLGLTLSGGLDSTSIACLVHKLDNSKLNTYTASFPNQPFDEYPIAKQISDDLGMKSIEVKNNYSDYLSTLKAIIYHTESGHGSPAIFPLWNIAKRAKEDITVYLEGQGADELLGGYINSVFIDYVKDLLKYGKIRKSIREYKFHSENWSIFGSALLYFRQNFSPKTRQLYRDAKGIDSVYKNELSVHKAFKLSYSDLKFDSYLQKRLFIQHNTGLVNLLHYGDAISMAHSLENRLPFMDYRLVEFIFQLPTEFKIKDGFGKFIHREAVKSIVPNKIINTKFKLGFLSPLKHVFIDEKYGAVELLLRNHKPEDNLFNHKKVNYLLKEHRSGVKNHERILFKILSVKLWFEVFF